MSKSMRSDPSIRTPVSRENPAWSVLVVSCRGHAKSTIGKGMRKLRKGEDGSVEPMTEKVFDDQAALETTADENEPLALEKLVEPVTLEIRNRRNKRSETRTSNISTVAWILNCGNG